MIAVCCMLGAIAFSACDSGNNGQQTTDATGNPTVAGLDTALTQDRQDLLAFTARNNMLQIELGRMAVEKGQTNNVKSYGQDLVNWYTTKQEELQELAQQYNVTLPQELDDEQRSHLEDIRGTEASKFDEEYWDTVTDAQKDAIDRLDNGLKDVDEANATAFSLWARNTVKELRAQMEQAKKYELELENREGGIAPAI